MMLSASDPPPHFPPPPSSAPIPQPPVGTIPPTAPPNLTWGRRFRRWIGETAYEVVPGAELMAEIGSDLSQLVHAGYVYNFKLAGLRQLLFSVAGGGFFSLAFYLAFLRERPGNAGIDALRMFQMLQALNPSPQRLQEQIGWSVPEKPVRWRQPKSFSSSGREVEGDLPRGLRIYGKPDSDPRMDAAEISSFLVAAEPEFPLASSPSKQFSSGLQAGTRSLSVSDEDS